MGDGHSKTVLQEFLPHRIRAQKKAILSRCETEEDNLLDSEIS